MSEWFRNEDWSPEIEEQFFRKLSRARSQKAQYLRIQACYLSKKKPEIALSLLDRYFELGDHFGDAQAFVDQAHSFDALGDREQSAASFEKALLREQEFPNSLTQAGYEFPLFVAMHKMASKYGMAIEVTERYRAKAVFPVNLFCGFAASALISLELGSEREAADFARQALSAAAMQSPFPRHSSIGLVDNKYDEVKAQLQKLILGDK
jgi:tetratricopeptide (TPR) repeat protein